MNDTILRMLREARETKDVLASAAVFIRGVPGLLREAILKALDANKNLTEADLAEMKAVADELDAGQAVIIAAIAEGTLAAGQPLPDGLSIAEREALKHLPAPEPAPLPPEPPPLPPGGRVEPAPDPAPAPIPEEPEAEAKSLTGKHRKH